MISQDWSLLEAWKLHQWMPVTWYTFKWHPTCQTPCQDYPVLQDSKVRLKGHNESWQCSVCLNGLKLSGWIQNIFLSTLKTILMVSGTILSSKTPGSDFEDIGSLDGLFAVQSWWNLQYWFRIHFLANLYQFQWSQEPSILQDSRVRLRGHRESWWTPGTVGYWVMTWGFFLLKVNRSIRITYILNGVSQIMISKQKFLGHWALGEWTS